MSEEANNGVRFTVKELLLDLRADVKNIDAKLDQKADRSRVHDLSNLIAATNLAKADRADVIALAAKVERLDTLRDKFLGASAVLAAISGTILGRLLGAW